MPDKTAYYLKLPIFVSKKSTAKKDRFNYGKSISFFSNSLSNQAIKNRLRFIFFASLPCISEDSTKFLIIYSLFNYCQQHKTFQEHQAGKNKMTKKLLDV
jgi:hypothetical protein